MRWVSTTGEFAFLSFGSSARGIIAVGGMAHGVIAFGAIVSVGVCAVGMNAVGSVVALGMNAAAPISLSLINGVGIYTRAGVNGWGAWSQAGTNSTGLTAEGGVNTDYSVLPAVVVLALMLVISSVVRGKRTPRVRPAGVDLRSFVRSEGPFEAEVDARLVAVGAGALELASGSERVSAQASESLVARARAIATVGKAKRVWVVAQLARLEERMPVDAEVSYRERPAETTRAVVRCLAIAPAPEPESWLPKDSGEVQWVIAWTARIAAVAAIALLVWARL